MEMEIYYNQKKVNFTSKIKTHWLKWQYGKSVEFENYPIIFGLPPIFKVPGKSKIIIGDRVNLDSHPRKSHIPIAGRCKFVCGVEGIIEVGANTILNGVGITSYKKVSIGKNCLISSNTFITDTDLHPIDPELRQKVSMGYKADFSTVLKKEITIGDNVWIGWGVIILKGVSIGDNSIIAAGSVVTNSIPSNVIAAGNPAKIIRDL
jgi:acetyltransferase-like isoleucine patch superfamily enzyme